MKGRWIDELDPEGVFKDGDYSDGTRKIIPKNKFGCRKSWSCKRVEVTSEDVSRLAEEERDQFGEHLCLRSDIHVGNKL